MRHVKHETVLANISGFLEARSRLGVNGPVIETVFYSMRENEHEVEQYLNYWRGKVDHARLMGGISESFKDKENAVAPRRQPCKVLRERMTILWNGDVTLCSLDVDGRQLLGNIQSQSIEELWNCEQLMSVRKAHAEGCFHELPFCAECDM